jgi:hypothetical protein
VLGRWQGVGSCAHPPKNILFFCFKYWCLKNTKSVVSDYRLHGCRRFVVLWRTYFLSVTQVVASWNRIIYQVRKFSTY